MAPWSGRKSRLLLAPISERGHGASAIAPETAGVTRDAHGLGDPESPWRGEGSRAVPGRSCGKGKPSGG